MADDPLRTIDVLLRLLEMTALLFPVVLIVIQTTFRMGVRDRETEPSRWYWMAVLGIGVSVVYLAFFASELLRMLRGQLSQNQFGDLITWLNGVLLFLILTSLVLLADVYVEVSEAGESADEAPDQKPNTTQTKLSGTDGDGQ